MEHKVTKKQFPQSNRTDLKITHGHHRVIVTMTTKTNVLFLLSASNLQAYSQNFPVQLDHAYHSQSHVNKFSGRQHFPLNIQLLFPMKPEKITENLAHEKDVLSSPISISVHSSSIIEFLIPLHVFHFFFSISVPPSCIAYIFFSSYFSSSLPLPV